MNKNLGDASRNNGINGDSEQFDFGDFDNGADFVERVRKSEEPFQILLVQEEGHRKSGVRSG